MHPNVFFVVFLLYNVCVYIYIYAFLYMCTRLLVFFLGWFGLVWSCVVLFGLVLVGCIWLLGWLLMFFSIWEDA